MNVELVAVAAKHLVVVHAVADADVKHVAEYSAIQVAAVLAPIWWAEQLIGQVMQVVEAWWE